MQACDKGHLGASKCLKTQKVIRCSSSFNELSIGVLFRLVWLKAEGTGLDGFSSMYPSIFPKGHMGLRCAVFWAKDWAGQGAFERKTAGGEPQARIPWAWGSGDLGMDPGVQSWRRLPEIDLLGNGVFPPKKMRAQFCLCPKRIDPSTFWFCKFGPYLVKVPKGQPLTSRSFGQGSGWKIVCQKLPAPSHLKTRTLGSNLDACQKAAAFTEEEQDKRRASGLNIAQALETRTRNSNDTP